MLIEAYIYGCSIFFYYKSSIILRILFTIEQSKSKLFPLAYVQADKVHLSLYVDAASWKYGTGLSAVTMKASEIGISWNTRRFSSIFPKFVYEVIGTEITLESISFTIEGGSPWSKICNNSGSLRQKLLFFCICICAEISRQISSKVLFLLNLIRQ